MRDKPDHQPPTPKQSVKAGRNENCWVVISSPVQYPLIRGLLNANKRQISGCRPQIFRERKELARRVLLIKTQERKQTAQRLNEAAAYPPSWRRPG
jgi:hypothetical protein